MTEDGHPNREQPQENLGHGQTDQERQKQEQQEHLGQEPPEEANAAAAPGRASSSAGQAVERADKEAKPRGDIFAFALAAFMVCMGFLRELIRKPAASLAANPAANLHAEKPQADVPISASPCPCEAAEQSGDRTLERGSDAEVLQRRRRGTPLVLFAFLVGMAGGVGFMFLYWTGGGNRLLGVTLALCLGGFGTVLVLYAKWMIRHELVIAPREEMPSNREDRKNLFKDYASGVHDVQRRGLLKWMVAGAVGLFAAIIVSLLRSLARTAPEESLFSTVWIHGQRLMTVEGKPLTVDSLQPGSSMTVFPENDLGSVQAQTVLIRVDQDLLQLPSGRANWAPMGYVAYSRVCTHAGCAVGMFEAHSNLLLCPCHQSTFDVLRGAVPTGGPAARPLPQLPLYLDSNGNLRAGGGFTSPPGPGFTGMPS